MVKSLIVALFAAVASLVNVSVGMGDLRVSLGILVLIVALYMNRDMNPVPTAIVTGIFVFIVRLIVASFSGHVVADLALSYLLEVLFYIGYGALFDFLIVKDKHPNANPLLLILMICDFGANALELVARYTIQGDALQSLTLQNLFLAAFVRSAIIWIVIRVLQNKEHKTA